MPEGGLPGGIGMLEQEGCRAGRCLVWKDLEVEEGRGERVLHWEGVGAGRMFGCKQVER